MTKDGLATEGFIYDLNEELYHSLDLFSNSAGKRLHDCPASSLIPFKSTKATEFGTPFHAFVLEPDVFNEKYVFIPDFGDQRKTSNKTMRLEFEERNPGKTFLPEKDKYIMQNMKDSVFSHPLIPDILNHGRQEVTIFWKDPITGIDCKCRIDHVPSKFKILVDLKSTKDSSFIGFGRSILQYKYYMQAHVYMRAYNLYCKPKDRVNAFLFLAVEKTPPFRFNPIYIPLDNPWIELGAKHWHEALEIERKCRETGVRNTYNCKNDELMEASFPNYLFKDLESVK